jgi:hypothetical protein
MTRLFVAGLLASALSSCYDVHEGYRVDYGLSPSLLTVTPENLTRGAIGDTIHFNIHAEALSDIKSIIVTTSTSGKEGTGFAPKAGLTDPLIDHTYGTIEKNTRSLDLGYDYIVAQDTVNVTVGFSMIDGDGKRDSTFDIVVVPSITRFDSIALYSNNSQKTDGFSTAEGQIYRNLAEYASVSETNTSVQESLDLVFIVSGSSAVLCGPYDGYFSSSMKIRNKTKLAKLSNLTDSQFEHLTNASLSMYVEEAKVGKGATSVSGLQVGDFVGFRTDFASTNSYKYGILRIKALHPANCSWYDGLSFVLEMDVVTQYTKK